MTRQSWTHAAARLLALFGSLALLVLSAMLLLDVPLPLPWPFALASMSVLTALAVMVALRAPGTAVPAANQPARRIGRRLTPPPLKVPDYEALLAELETHRRMERELVSAKQASEAAMMAKGEFLATMSHEIRTPLNGIIPLLDILLGSKLEPDQREYVGTAYQSARQLLRIVDDILDYSKLEANKLELEAVGINLRELLDSVMRLIEKPAEGKGLRLALRIDPSVRLAVRGDPVRLRQVLINLLSNAVKFTERGSVVLSVTRKGETGTHHELRFEVRDTGVGIAPPAAQKLFQPFSQADASTTRTYGGTGLGLVICKRIIDLMDGRIGVESQPGRGSLFWFEVPLLKAVGDIGGGRRELNGARALVLTSDERLKMRLAVAMPNWGVTFVHAGSTQEALAKLRSAAGRSDSWAFHLLLVDLASIRTTALALHRNLQRESGLESVQTVYLQGDVPPPAEIADSPRALTLPRESPEAELRTRITRFLEGPPAAGSAAPLLELRDGSLPEFIPPAARSAEGPLHGHVLLVEDNPVNLQVAQRLLTLAGVTLDVAENGREALEKLEQRHYDAVLMDCQMPVMDGYSATRRQREREQGGAGAHVPIIAMTANAMVGDREKCLEAGMDDYLSKPLNRALLADTLRRWLPDGSDATREAAVAQAPTSARRPPPQRAPGAPAAPAPAAVPARPGPAQPSPAPARVPPARMPPPTRLPGAGIGPGSGARPVRPAAPAQAPASMRAAPPRAAPSPAAGAANRPPPRPAPSPTAGARADAPPAAPALQPEVIEDLRDIMGAEFESLVRVFLEDAPVTVRRLQVAAKGGDNDELIAAAHSLKSTSANLGAMRLSELARQIEHGARRGELTDPVTMVRAMTAEFDRAAAALRQLVR